MYIHCRLICVVECFRNYNVQRELTNEHPYNFSTSINLENSTCLQNQENNSLNLNNDINRPNTKTTPGYANAYNPSLIYNFRQYQNEFPIFHNFSSSNYHYENISINNRNDFMMRYNEIYFNIVRQLYDFLLVFKTQQNQNINDSNQNICVNKEDYKTDANEEIKNVIPIFDNSSKSVNTTVVIGRISILLNAIIRNRLLGRHLIKGFLVKFFKCKNKLLSYFIWEWQFYNQISAILRQPHLSRRNVKMTLMKELFKMKKLLL